VLQEEFSPKLKKEYKLNCTLLCKKRRTPARGEGGVIAFSNSSSLIQFIIRD